MIIEWSGSETHLFGLEKLIKSGLKLRVGWLIVISFGNWKKKTVTWGFSGFSAWKVLPILLYLRAPVFVTVLGPDSRNSR